MHSGLSSFVISVFNVKLEKHNGVNSRRVNTTQTGYDNFHSIKETIKANKHKLKLLITVQ